MASSAYSLKQSSASYKSSSRPQTFVRLNDIDDLPRASSRAKHGRSSSVSALGNDKWSPASAPLLNQSTRISLQNVPAAGGRPVSVASTVPGSRQSGASITATPVLKRRPESSYGISAQPLDPTVWNRGSDAPVTQSNSSVARTVTSVDFLANYTASTTSASEHLRAVLQTLKMHLIPRDDGNYAPATAADKARMKLKIYRPPHTEIYESRETPYYLAVYAAFQDCTVAWYRIDWPTTRRPLLGFKARISHAVARDDMKNLKDNEGMKIAALAKKWARAGKPVATLDGKDRGVCKSMIKNVLARHGLEWGPFHARVFSAGMRGETKSPLDNARPGDIIYLKNVRFYQVTFDKHGRIIHHQDYKIKGPYGHVAIIVGAGEFHSHNPNLETVVNPDQATTLSYQSKGAPTYLQLVDQSPKVDPVTRILQMDTMQFLANDGQVIIYRPMIRNIWYSYRRLSEIGDHPPRTAGRACTDITGAPAQNVPRPNSMQLTQVRGPSIVRGSARTSVQSSVTRQLQKVTAQSSRGTVKRMLSSLLFV